MSANNGGTWTSIAGATGSTFTPVDAPNQAFGPQAGNLLRVVVTFTDAFGHAERLESTATAPVGVFWAGNANNNTFQGLGGDDTASGAGGNDTLNGNDGADTLNGDAGADTLNGGGDNDALNGGDGGDTITGGGGNDTITGGGGTDVARYALSTHAYVLTENGNGLIVTAVNGAEGSDTINAVETLRFNEVDYGVMIGTGTGQTLTGGVGNQVIAGRGGNDTLNGGDGNDIILAGAGNDRINQNASAVGGDFVDGGGGTDTYVLTGTAATEEFQILTRAAAIEAGIIDLHSTTEIVITRRLAGDPPDVLPVIVAELDNVEEIQINTLPVTANNGNGVVDGGIRDGDSITVVGNFTQTSLNYSTITVNGGKGTDKVDITNLTSDHRIVLNSNGGSDEIIGAVRSQDLINDSSSSGFTLDRNALADLRNDPHTQLQTLFEGLPQHAGWSFAAKNAALMMQRAFDGPNHVHKFAHDWVMEGDQLRFDDIIW
jgi:hypothetical protein